MLQQRERAVADQVHGRLVPRQDQQEQHRHQLVLGQLVVAVAGLDQGRRQVVGRLGLAEPDQAAEGASEQEEARHLAHDVEQARSAVLDHRVHPAAQLHALRLRHPDHLGDDRQRQREREVGDQIDRAARRGPIQQRRGQPLDRARQRLDPPRGEHPLDERAEPAVPGLVLRDHRRVERADHRREPPLIGAPSIRAGVPRVAHETRISQRAVHVVVARQQPDAAEERQANRGDGRLSPQAGVERIRILADLRVGEIDLERHTGLST
ncbi:hypothetical protein OV079_02060 [Nannocystis pusilla]|uniref:Uncharacterized protein n=1 Tax=Nannocystis pusilla TaxID=889268 RepID=A0A9X3EHW0_9BACT|nr:hypothetical protein [Nannocystis pusilla]MCY1004369.1 hypothetical protein [Nannocystis pusilla]